MRWLLVPALAAVVVVVPGFIASFVMPRAAAQLPGTPPRPVADLPRIVLPWIVHDLTGAAVVIAGAKTAPRGHFATASVLSILWILSALLSHVLMQPSTGVRNYAHFAVAALSGVAGAAYCFYSAKSKDREARSKPPPPD